MDDDRSFGGIDPDEAMGLLPDPSDLMTNKTARIYRRWRCGKITDKEARDMVGDEFDDFHRLAANDDIVERTIDPSNDDDDLFFSSDE